MISATPAITNRMPAPVVQWNGSRNINTEESATVATAPEAVLGSWADLIGHVHASEPDLVPLGDGGTDHTLMYNALRKHLPNSVVSIEMVATNDQPHLHSIERAITRAVECYRSE